MRDDRPQPDQEGFERRPFPLELSIPSDVSYIEHVVGVVVDRCRELDLPSQLWRLNIRVALTEALSNAILYGNREDARKTVRLRASLEDRELVLEVEDEGLGFDLERCTVDPTLDENILREDGRGLFLMRQLVDRVEQFARGGNIVRLTIRCP
jgi:serine/threonine-protein kinase RsbW